MSEATASAETLDKIIDLLEEVSGEDDVRDHLDEDLFDLGYLDSMGAVELLLAIEDEMGVSIAPTEVPREQMNTANLIAYQVEQRLG
ncbi:MULTISPECIES: D-alanine--poly(phosphoribitol) ligase subunit DltC [Atopobiaceae]|uniref:D-alanyl carrier protein n=1 Tax=Parafannyhessea umbonata TaxID=604330 RepID=A0A1H9N8V0_9ACTN|nr:MULTISPECIES: D-alanine--poly(phosphoribitol) ligase subunit DltC [Atopobiaceae]SEH39004.1 D-alanine--poly(phosphoribitol) ligase subunit 2 [Parafannyhessea umbonata]SER32328.1 D-alanine--poly(phosphoribitol) ligase subunit 2 [Parafannyhessea umbonata]SJZ42479.1 D-alanine--poly(phosphoribitol) ligase subunit 2 [Olsenella sp. KH1P3]